MEITNRESLEIATKPRKEGEHIITINRWELWLELFGFQIGIGVGRRHKRQRT